MRHIMLEMVPSRSLFIIFPCRVYVAKHEIFATDVTNCFTSLKKAVNELRMVGVPSESLEMASASVRPETIAFTGAYNDIHFFNFDFDLREPVSR